MTDPKAPDPRPADVEGDPTQNAHVTGPRPEDGPQDVSQDPSVIYTDEVSDDAN